MARIHPFIAVILSLLLPGSGHWYAGLKTSAMVLMGIFVILAILANVCIFIALPAAWFFTASLITMGLSLLFYGTCALQSWWAARQEKRHHGNAHLLSAITLIPVVWLGILQPTHNGINNHLYEVFTVPSSSMEPTILPGDFLIADKRLHCRSCTLDIKRGDIVTFIYPNDRRQRYIKRIIGLPGDRVSIQQQQVSINNLNLKQRRNQHNRFEILGQAQYFIQWDNNDTRGGDWKVPPGHVFVLGDNRSHSKDSRVFGFIPLRDIEGISSQVWFSYDNKDGLRRNRSGLLLQ